MCADDSKPDATWFTEARFGMFIHWGIYAAAARHEWVKNYEHITTEQYQKYFDHFDPDLYDPRQWARMAKQAGMEYFVITTKHHDGFCLWDSKLTDYKAANTPAGRDLLRPALDACREEGLKVGLYHSLIDWHHPEFPVDTLHPQRDDMEFREREKGRDMAKYREYLYGQVRELLTEYGRIDLMFFDFSYTHHSEYKGLRGKGKEDWQSEKLLAMVRELQPDMLVNDRLEIPADYGTPEQALPRGPLYSEGVPVTWEACNTLNGSWGYHRDNLDWKTPDMLVRMLIDCASKGGNFILNVGPNARGEFEPRAVEMLERIGEWTRLHERSICGAGPSEFECPPDCRLTQRNNRLYLHIFAWPMKHVYLDGLAGKAEYAQLLNDNSEIQVTETAARELLHRRYTSPADREDAILLHLPIQRPNVLVPVVEVFLK